MSTRARLLNRRNVLGTALVVISTLTATAPPGGAHSPVDGALAKVGAWIKPFEEGGVEVPRCRTDEEPGWAHGSLICKPSAATMIALPDGRVLYWDGLEGSENVEHSYGPEISPKSRNAEARLLDLRSGAATFTTPSPSTGGGTNREHAKGLATNEPFGMAGVPGRPGNGLVGSTWGSLGLPEQKPSASQDDHYWTNTDLFCSDLAGMADGRILIVGGIDWYNEPDVMSKHRGDPAYVGLVELGGLKTTRIFDPKTNRFSEGADMHHPRWYPTLVALPDGKFLAASGVVKLIKSTQLSSVRRTETYDPATNTWTENYVGPQSENSLPFVARLHLMPNGKVLYTGAGESWAPFGQAADQALWGLQQLFDPAKKTWEVAGVAPFGMARDIPSSVLLPLKPPYDKGTVLTFGGTLGPSPGGYVAVPFSTLTTVDSQGRVTNEMTGNLNEARWSPAGIPLADGTVLAMTGARNSSVLTPGFDLPVHSAEIYDPATGKWTKVASSLRDRSYHYSATLLADGRVLVGGAAPIGTMYGPHRTVGGPFANNNRDASFEIYSPPYLFRGPRPKISHAPAGIAWGRTFRLETPDAANIESVLLVRPPSQQHAMDSNSRSVELAFRQTAPDRLEVVAPPGGTVAPPGAYYLFVNRKNPGGLTPSVARVVYIGEQSNDAEAFQPFPDDFAGITGGSATPLTASPRGGDTYLGPAGTAANQAMGGATPTIAAVQEESAKLDLTAVPVGWPLSPYRRNWFVPS
ncbi:MAG TPA: galactose oxidase-like domain-containing protein [Acidimicrobiia bacterium]|nr:galactose oxidase-like domain-containing protein [Acidimicrobiia bacterium]